MEDDTKIPYYLKNMSCFFEPLQKPGKITGKSLKYLDLLMKVRKLEREYHLGLMRLEDYLERRSLIFYELLGID